jgi:multidrug efflux system membrane fusion protein
MSKSILHHLKKLIFRFIIIGFIAYFIIYFYNKYTVAVSIEQTLDVPKVEVIILELSNMRSWYKYSGRLSPVEVVEIKPLISGVLDKILFEEGQNVKKGDSLYVIDPRPHITAKKRAEAQLQIAKTQASLMNEELERAQQLRDSNSISKSLFDEALSDHKIAQAEVKKAQAELINTELNLEYAHIDAPIDGRIGRTEVTVGNVVVSGSNSPVLTYIIAVDRFYVEFNVSEKDYIEILHNTYRIQDMPVELTLTEDGSIIYQGKMHSFDNHLDISSGTIRARAIVDNVDEILAPGMYVNIRMGSPTTSNSILVPKQLIRTNQSKKYVYVINDNNRVEYREVILGDDINGYRVILKGLTEGERIASNSLSHLQKKMLVEPIPKL